MNSTTKKKVNKIRSGSSGILRSDKLMIFGSCLLSTSVVASNLRMTISAASTYPLFMRSRMSRSR
jgi:hypothetical protein